MSQTPALRQSYDSTFESDTNVETKLRSDLGLKAIKAYEILPRAATGGNRNNHCDLTLS